VQLLLLVVTGDHWPFSIW